MKSLYTLSIILVLWVFPNTSKAQLLGFDSASTNMGSLPDTINLNDTYVHTLVLQNADSVNDFTGTIYLVAGIDTGGTLLSVDTVGSVFVSNLNWLDTISITYTETYDTPNGYKLGDNIVVVWPVAGTIAIRDTIRQHVFINNPAAIQSINNENKDVLIFPNPFSNQLNIKIVGTEDKLKQVRLFDASGRIVVIENSNRFINTESISKGLYFLELEFYNHDRFSYKLIKE